MIHVVLFACLLAACVGPPAPSPTTPRSVLTVRTDTTDDPKLQLGFGAIAGVIVDARTSELLPGATIAATPEAGSAVYAISDDVGAFRVEVAARPTTLDIYYLETTFTQSGIAVRVGEVVHVRIELGVRPDPPQHRAE